MVGADVVVVDVLDAGFVVGAAALVVLVAVGAVVGATSLGAVLGGGFVGEGAAGAASGLHAASTRAPTTSTAGTHRGAG